MTSDAASTKPAKGHAVKPGHLAVSEFLGELQGPASPFGNITLPLPVDQIDYTHPDAHSDAHEDGDAGR